MRDEQCTESYLDKFVLVFIDDILVYSNTKEKQKEGIIAVLQLLREHKLYTNLNKWELFQSQIHNLGHIVSKEGVAIDREKVKAIMEWETLRNAAEFRLFIGLLSY